MTTVTTATTTPTTAPTTVSGQRSVVTPRGWLTLALGVAMTAAGLGFAYPLVAGVGVVLLVVVAVEVASVLSAGHVDVRRELHPPVVVRGDPCRAVLHVTGRRRSGLVRLEASDLVGRPGGRSRLVPVRLPASDVTETGQPATTSVDYEVPTTRRGLLDVGPVRLRRFSLCGMAAAVRDVGGVRQVRVLPRRIPLSAVASGRRRSAAGPDAGVEIGGTDLIGLHEYAMGDDLRRLHWATSARTGTLMVRDDVDPAEAHLCVLLDDRLASYWGSEDLAPADAFEEAIELAAALCRVGIDRGHPLRLRTTSGRHDIDVAGSLPGRPPQESADLDLLFSEIEQVSDDPGDAHANGSAHGLPGSAHDVVVAVTGAAADSLELGLLLGDAATRVVCVVDPAPLIGSGQHAGILYLRGSTSHSLAEAWERWVAR